MAYFVKQMKQKNKNYLAIYESHYDPIKKETANSCIKSYGEIEKLRAKGIEDPIAYLQDEVQKMNAERKKFKSARISDKSLKLKLGYFPLKSIMEKLEVKNIIDLFSKVHNFDFSLYELISSLVYARSISPCSKRKTFHDVLPMLYESNEFSYNQLLSGLDFIGNDYQKFVSLFTTQVKEKWGINTSCAYFDCTNFFFEIDREDDFRRKGPSKENQKSPIIGLGLLLDQNQIPIGMKLYPGNESEKPIIREVIQSLKRETKTTGKIVHVADKGLNCAENVAFAKKNGDGYLFSKTVKGLSEKEKTWVLLDVGFETKRDAKGNQMYRYKSCIDKFPYTVEYNGKKITVEVTEKRLLTYNFDLATKKRYEINKLVAKAKKLVFSKAKQEEYGETAKYMTFADKDGEKAIVSINQAAIDKDLLFAGYNLLVTSETEMSDDAMYSTYHHLWRIEESFRIMKSDLDARPVYLQKENTIKGHFLICYITVLLERLFQFAVLKDKYSTSEIFKFIKGFELAKTENLFVNLTKSTTFVTELEKILNLPLTLLYMNKKEVNAIMKLKI